MATADQELLAVERTLPVLHEHQLGPHPKLVFRRFSQICEKRLLDSWCPSLRPSAWKTVLPIKEFSWNL